jgi:ATP-binding cassette subfamily B protein
MVLQDTWIFEGTVRENILYNRKGLSEKELWNIVEAVGLRDYVEQLPQGLDTLLDESVSLSAGQRQLMTIARAMAVDAPLLILDEATSSVDTRTEFCVQQAMDQLMKGRTSFVIAHRLSTIRNADIIFVLQDGNVVESGSHEVLLAHDGLYAQIYHSQFEAE